MRAVLILLTFAAATLAQEEALDELIRRIDVEDPEERDRARRDLEAFAWDHAAEARPWLERRRTRAATLEEAEALAGAIDLLVLGRRRELPPAPIHPRTEYACAAVSRRVVVWGGRNDGGNLDDGAVFDLDSWQWRRMAPSPLASRFRLDLVAVAGGRVLLWGGMGVGGTPSSHADGAWYDPASDLWEPLPPAPLRRHAYPDAVWTGEEFILWAHRLPENVSSFTGAIYDPSCRRWREIGDSPLSDRRFATTVWTGERLLVWGGSAFPPDRRDLSDGYLFDPRSDEWVRIPPAPAASSRPPLVSWTGARLVVWGGGWNASSRRITDPSDAAAFDPATGAWTAVARAPCDARSWGSAVPLGPERLVLLLGHQAAVLDLARNEWERLPDVPVPHDQNTAGYRLGQRIVALGDGCGAVLDPVANEWRAYPAGFVPRRRVHALERSLFFWSGELPGEENDGILEEGGAVIEFAAE